MVRPRSIRVFVPVLLALLVGGLGTAHAQDTYTLAVLDTGMVAGSLGTVDIAFENTGTEIIQGFNIDVCHDPAVLEVQSIAMGPFLAGLNGGAGPDFLEQYPDAQTNGLVLGAIFSVLGIPDEQLPPGSYAPLFSVTYLVDANPPATTTVEFCDIPSCPGCLVADTIVVALGQSIIPAQIPGTVTFGPAFLRGDANDDGVVDLGDPIATLDYLFSGGEVPPCLAAADVNDDDTVNMADPIFELGYLFAEGAPPAAPFPGCGADPTAGTMSCDSVGGCP